MLKVSNYLLFACLAVRQICIMMSVSLSLFFLVLLSLLLWLFTCYSLCVQCTTVHPMTQVYVNTCNVNLQNVIIKYYCILYFYL